MKTHLVHVPAAQLAPWVSRLQLLEKDFSYPIDDGRDLFTIAHGDGYHPFFSELGDAHFLLAVNGDEVVGCYAGIRKQISTAGGPVDAAYLGDLKIRRDHRGTGLPARMLARALRISLGDWSRYRWRFAFGAAMRGERGDVMRSARGLHLMRVTTPRARLAMYFSTPAQLAGLDATGAPASPRTPGLQLSPGSSAPFVTTRGKKDYVLQSTGRPWTLVHLPRGPAQWGRSHAAYLKEAGSQLTSEPGPVCFALDERLAAERTFLAEQGLQPGATCTVYALSLDPRTRGAAWVHLATSEI